MAAISLYRFNLGAPVYVQGSLFGLIAELRAPSQVESYRRAPLGWSSCPLGYGLYKFPLGNEQIVVPGILYPEMSSPKRKFPNYSLRFPKAAIEEFAEEMQNVGDEVDAASAALVANLTHDLRALSGQIYNSSEVLKSALDNNAYSSVRRHSDSITAAQQMLSLRLDMLDYSTGLALERDPEAIPVYKKYDKVVKCFQPNADVSEIKLEIAGPSQGYTFGAPVFELVPFVLVENAMKYSPKKSIVKVKVTDFEKYIDAHVQSFGPKITRAEIERLFEQGFRGEAARKSGKSGSGIGLYAAKSLIRGSFNGELSVTQDAVAINMDGAEVWGTTFSCRVPRVY